jgi:uncharacterized protein (DUF427 family)
VSDDPDVYARERERWRNARRERPLRIEPTGPGEESVWDYPRPPRIEVVSLRLRVELGGVRIADTVRGRRVLETSSPPVYYFPPEDVRRDLLEASPDTTFCEWKGVARSFAARAGERRVAQVAWSYPEPDEGYEAIRDHFAFFPGRVDACWVGEERVTPQPGDYYGGWITANVKGPFKGRPGTELW